MSRKETRSCYISDDGKRTHRNYKIIGADFETDHNQSEGWVAQWAAVEAIDYRRLKYRQEHGYTLDGFKQYIYRLMENPSIQYYVYFHNLKYDVNFMWGFINELMELCADDERYMPPIVRMGAPIIMRFRNIEFRDSARKMPAGTTVAQMGDMIGLPKLESPRGNFDAGWSKDLTDDEFQYVIHDAAIVALIMQQMHFNDATHATTSGDAWASARAIYNKVNGRGAWDDDFPELSLDMYDLFWPAYQGGLNISHHKGIIHDTICHVDRNSMYPSILSGVPSMGVVPVLPCGQPKRLKKGTPSEAGYELYIMRATMKLRLKPGMIPVFHFKLLNDAISEGFENTTEFVVETKEWHELMLSSVEYANICRFYEVRFKPNAEVAYWCFDARAGLFKDYVDYWYDKKKNAKDKVDRNLAKLMLNSLYGRFGMSPYQDEFSLEFDPMIDDYRPKGRRMTRDEVTKVPGYLPIAIFTCAWARWALCDAILTVGPMNVIHCDTDSVIYFGTIHDTDALGHTDALGDWKEDYEGLQWMVEGGVKRYMEFRCDEPSSLDDFRCTCAGVQQRMKNGCPLGMWLELMDDPALLIADGAELGHPHYQIRSEWLRRLLIEHGYDPDDMNTMIDRPTQRGRIKGGILFLQNTFRMRDNMMIRFR